MKISEAVKYVNDALVHLRNQPYCEGEALKALEALKRLKEELEPHLVFEGDDSV